jgi:DNA-binding NtrC family response regulator
MKRLCVLIVEADLLVRHPLAEFLRACGYMVLEAANAAEARTLLTDDGKSVDAVLADASAKDESGFTLRAWITTHCPGVEVILAGSEIAAASAAGELCEKPGLNKPYDHQLVLRHIRQLQAARDRAR